MIKTNIAKWLGYLALIGCFAISTPAHAAKGPSSSILIDAESGEVLSLSNADIRRQPASLTKLMTLYITFNALENGSLKMDDKLPVSRTAANRSPSKLGLRVGEKISVRDAIMALIVKSANDCATVLAEGLGYTEENFAKTMTEVAHELGMKNTTFKNASGLPNSAQLTSARDMAVLAAAMYHHFPQHYKLFSSKSFTYKGQKIYTHNHLLKTFEGADGMKTGFTNAAGYNIITSAQRNGHRVIVVTMGHNSIKERDTKAANLMNQGLRKLAMADHLETPNLYANLSATPKKTEDTHKIAHKSNENWGIQIGAFSNYAKARNYALSIKKQIKKQYAYVSKTSVSVEPAQKGSAIIYRSKIVGFEKNEADKTCKSLKKSNKSCIVIATMESKQLAMAGK